MKRTLVRHRVGNTKQVRGLVPGRTGGMRSENTFLTTRQHQQTIPWQPMLQRAINNLVLFMAVNYATVTGTV